MSEQLEITVEQRQKTGRNIARKMSRDGKVAAVVYGAGRDSVPITVDRKTILELLKKAASENAIYLLRLGGSKNQRHVMIRDMQVDPVSQRILHIDFQRVLMDQLLRVQAPLELQGVPAGVRNDGGVLDFVTRELEVECLPKDIPDLLTLDVTELEIGDHLEASQVTLPEGVTLVEEPDRTIASVNFPRPEEEEEPEEEELLLEAEAEEPEVIGRGKDEEEEEGEEPAEG